MKKYILYLICVVIIVLLFMMGCINMRLEVDIDYPQHLFKETAKKIKGIHTRDPTRKGMVSKLNLLLYDGGDRKMIGLTIPLGVVETTLKDHNSQKYREFSNYKKKYLRADIEEIRDLHQLGPGLLVEIEVVHNNTHVLIWLD